MAALGPLSVKNAGVCVHTLRLILAHCGIIPDAPMTERTEFSADTLRPPGDGLPDGGGLQISPKRVILSSLVARLIYRCTQRGNQEGHTFVDHLDGGTMRRALVLLFALALPASVEAATCSVPNSITKVANRKAGGFEYVDFYVKAPFSGSVTVSAPSSGNFTQDPSGDAITVAGNKWAEVKFTGMFWMCSSARSFSLPKPIIKDIKSIGEFEGQIDYVIGRNNGHYLGSTTSTVSGKKRITLKFGP
jgi:hypothetical protein